MSTRLYGNEAIAFARENELDDLLVCDAEGNWRFAGLADAIEAQSWAENMADAPAPRVVAVDLEDDET
jgi:hypothetical protein